MHTVNSKKLKELIQAKGGPYIVAEDSMVSASMLKKMSAGVYACSPGRATRHLLSAYFGVAESDLFPLARKRTTKAS